MWEKEEGGALKKTSGELSFDAFLMFLSLCRRQKRRKKWCKKREIIPKAFSPLLPQIEWNKEKGVKEGKETNVDGNYDEFPLLDGQNDVILATVPSPFQD